VCLLRRTVLESECGPMCPWKSNDESTELLFIVKM